MASTSSGLRRRRWPGGRWYAPALFPLALDQLLDADPPRDDRQIGRERADPLEFLEDGVIVIHDPQEDLGGDVLDILGREEPTPRVGGMLDHVVDQAHVAIDEVIPGAGLLPQDSDR